MLENCVSDGVCVLRLAAPPLNTLTLPLLEAVGDALRAAQHDDSVSAILLTGDRRQFSAGADVHLFQQIDSDQDAMRLSRTFQEAFQQLEDSPKPTGVALAGTVVGGALELAMACHYRIAAQGSRFRMPEVNLGINPGAGGTQRLPRLVGVETALRILLNAETLSADQAVQCGLIDAVCEPQLLEERACSWLLEHPRPSRTTARTDQLQDSASIEQALQNAERRVGLVRAELIAPRKILELVRTGVQQSVQAGMLGEQTAFADCMATPATRNKIDLFFAVNETSRIEELDGVQPLALAATGVIGMGSMGTGIAQTLARAGFPVVVLDQDASNLERGRARIAKSLERRVNQGKLAVEQSARILESIRTTTCWEDLASLDLVVESVFEDVSVKRSVIGRLEQLLSPETIIATNTSTIPLDELAVDMKHPERLIGLHFFNPAPRMPLVEIIPREATLPTVQATVLQLAKRLRKTPVVVKNRAGFLVNRIFIPYVQEAFFLLEEGAEAEEIDAAAVRFGFPMGPLVLIDMAGVDILVRAQEILCRVFPRHGRLSEIASRLVQGGFVGQKARAGVYGYRPGDHTPHPHEESAEIVAEVRGAEGRRPRSVSAEEITERLVLRMVNEALYVLDEGIARSESDLDVAMILGTGFPDFRGGVIKYAKSLGTNQVQARLEKLAVRHGERFVPCRS